MIMFFVTVNNSLIAKLPANDSTGIVVVVEIIITHGAVFTIHSEIKKTIGAVQ